MPNIIKSTIIAGAVAGLSFSAPAATAQQTGEAFCDQGPVETGVCVVGAIIVIGAMLAMAGAAEASDSEDAYHSSSSDSGTPDPEQGYDHLYAGDTSIESGADGCFWGSVEHGPCH